jgi:hypothetical protein
MSFIDDAARYLEAAHLELCRQAAAFESGAMSVRRREPSGAWKDITVNEVERLQRNIKELDFLIHKYRRRRARAGGKDQRLA